MEEFVEKFYQAILKCDKGGFQCKKFAYFPKDCCEYASILLSKYLIEKCGVSFKDIVLTNSKMDVAGSLLHVWIRYKSDYIDITINQFDEYKDSSRYFKSSEFHDSLKYYASVPLDLTFKAHQIPTELDHDYNMILNELK